MGEMNRREFMKSSGAAATALATPAIAKGVRGANERLRVGLLGLGGRMSRLAKALCEMKKDVEIVAICDCDQKRLDAVANNKLNFYPELNSEKLKTYTDMRKMFEDKSIDAITNALGDRWHSLSTIWACQAGKHVYVEKPGTTNLFEGRQMVAAARKYNCMVQHGTQNRSSPNIREGIAKLKEGVIGDVYMARAIDYKIRGNLGRAEPEPVPDGLNWDAWLGPKPMHQYSKFWHRRWYWNLELASGCFANQAVHEVDILRWGLGLDQHPTEVTCTGGTFVHEDDRTCPTHIASTYRFGDAKPMVTFEHRSWYTNSEAGFRDKYPFVQPAFPVGPIFFGSEGYMIFPDYSSYHTFFGPKSEPGPSKSEEGHALVNRPHFENWVAAIRSRDHRKLSAEIEEGHKSMVCCLLTRAAYQFGRHLKFDPKTEKVIGNAEADRLLNEPKYRSPYVVPKEV